MTLWSPRQHPDLILRRKPTDHWLFWDVGVSVINSVIWLGFSWNFARNWAGTGNPRIQTISSLLPLTITGHNLRSGCGTWRSCNSSLTFLGDFVWAGQNRSPARQFRTRNGPASTAASKSWS